jgi:hypothetical protein
MAGAWRQDELDASLRWQVREIPAIPTWPTLVHTVGAGSTGTIPAGLGGIRHFATAPKYSGTVRLIMNYGTAGSFICAVSLLAGRMSS